MKITHLLALALLTGSVALADVTTMEQALAGKEFPLTLKFKDLDAGWRRLTASATVDPANIYRAMYGGAAAGYYYTKGQTVTVGGETYLVAYKSQMKALDMVAMQAAMRGGQPPEPEKPTATTVLALALLNLRSAGSLTDIRPFDLDAELGGGDAGGADDKDGEASLKNLRQIGVAVMAYIGERRVLPALADAKSAKEELVLYVRNKDVFNQPGNQKPYLPNPALSGKKVTDYDKPDKVVVFYEAAPGSDGTRGCLFLDGHAERVTEQQWRKLKEISQIP
ncbi:MAG: hypothetical protein PCFJNLEI_00691 [Verrucomicrobiae bacterium]|nr:hypothetical protein [Verrucomicrobiae bacterium]